VEAQRGSIHEWREQYARCMLKLDFEPVPDTLLKVSTKPIFDDIRIARSSFSPGFTIRDAELIKDGDDSFALLISHSNRIDVRKWRSFPLGCGDAALMRISDPGLLGSHESFKYVAMLVPFTELQARVADVGATVAERVPRDSEALQLLHTYIRTLEKGRLAALPQAHDIIRGHIIDLIGLSVSTHRALGESDLSAVTAARLNAALGYIAANFREPGLTLESVARAQGISTRYLQRLLEKTGTSLIAQVNELRLTSAFTLLSDPGFAAWRISQIALHTGFSDISHFNRMFKRRYGASPSEVRARARLEHPIERVGMRPKSSPR
jgi:AraC-like DNA-binding protein